VYIVAEGNAILSHFPQGKGTSSPRTIVEENHDPTKPWAYFNGSSSDTMNMSGGSFVLFLSPTLSYHVKMGFGLGTNNQE